MFTVQCPAHDVRYDSSGVILSPGWPESYPNLQMCSWSVTVEKGYNVTISVESFHTEREFDVLEIFDGNQRKNKTTHTHTHTHAQFARNGLFIHCFCFSSLVPVSPGPTANSPSLSTLSGDLPTPFNLTTSSHQFLVRWSSDHGTNKKGFKIRYVGEYQSMYPNFIFTTINYIYI